MGVVYKAEDLKLGRFWMCGNGLLARSAERSEALLLGIG